MHTKNTLADTVWFVTVRKGGKIETTIHGSEVAALNRRNNLTIHPDSIKIFKGEVV